MKSSYWSCSKFADWLRGAKKGEAKTSLGWSQWTQATKKQHPVRYWLAEDGLDHLQNFITWPLERLNDIRYYVNNRWVSGSHALTAHPRDIRPGTWCDLGNRFLPCMFNELVNFVEIELAWHNVLFDKAAQKQFEPPWWRRGWFRWRAWRSPESGLAYLKWASELIMDSQYGCPPGHPDHGKPTYQALGAMEIRELYTWWKDIYPNRPDPHEAGGWTEHCRLMREKAVSMGYRGSEFILSHELADDAERERSQRALDMSTAIEERYKIEDEQMMIRLIRVREKLWT